MFYETEAAVLAEDFSEVKRIMADVQPYRKVVKFEDGIELEVENRLFCDLEPAIDLKSYLSIGGKVYKVVDIKKWSDYIEALLYECKGRGAI